MCVSLLTVSDDMPCAPNADTDHLKMIDFFTEEQIAARELRSAAYHEAGHKILYERFGGAGDAVVWKNESRNPDERAWFGQFRPRTCPEVMRNAAIASGFMAPDLPSNWKVLVGMAGLLAEDIMSGETDDAGVLADTLFFAISMGDASASDLEQMGVTDVDNCGFGYETVEEAVRLLREEWRNVQQEAEELIASTADSGAVEECATSA